MIIFPKNLKIEGVKQVPYSSLQPRARTTERYCSLYIVVDSVATTTTFSSKINLPQRGDSTAGDVSVFGRLCF